jgi:hypothetical protein
MTRRIQGASFAVRAFVAMTLSLVSTGCLHVPPAMRLAATVPGRAPGLATVVFVRPARASDRDDYLVLIDEDSHFVGNLAPGTRLAVDVPPGPNVFYAWNSEGRTRQAHVYYAWNSVGWSARLVPANPTAATRVNTEPGQTRYVLVDTNAIDALAAVPAGAPAGDLEAALRETKQVVADRAAGQAMLDRQPLGVRERVAMGQDTLLWLDEHRALDDAAEALQAERP